jgi:hypothetical protein
MSTFRFFFKCCLFTLHYTKKKRKKTFFSTIKKMMNDDSAFKTFFYDGEHPDDFYFIFGANGKKIYFSRVTKRRTSLDRIPSDILDQVKERPQWLDSASLHKQRESLLKQFIQLKHKLEEIDNRLEGTSSFDHEEDARQEKMKEKEAEERQKRKGENADRFYESTFGKRKESPKQRPKHDSSSKKTRIDTIDCEGFLKERGVHSKKDWNEWIRKNHPDKGGTDEELCKKMISMAKLMGW